MSNTLTKNSNWRLQELGELLELVQHVHRDVNTVTFAQYLCTALGWRWLLHPGGKGGRSYVLARETLCQKYNSRFEFFVPTQTTQEMSSQSSTHSNESGTGWSTCCSSSSSSSSSNLGASCCWRSKESAPLSMASPADPASTSKAKVGRPSTTKARAAASSLHLRRGLRRETRLRPRKRCLLSP